MLNTNTLVAMILMMVSGYYDGQGVGSTAQIWQNDHYSRLSILFKTLFFFGIGIVSFITSIYFINKGGLQNPLIMTLIWFIMTIVSVAFLSGSFFQLDLLDKSIVILAVVLIGFLYYRGVAN